MLLSQWKIFTCISQQNFVLFILKNATNILHKGAQEVMIKGFLYDTGVVYSGNTVTSTDVNAAVKRPYTLYIHFHRQLPLSSG